MRELYAVQIDLRENPNAPSPVQLIREWVARGSGLGVAEVESSAEGDIVTDRGHTLEFALDSDADEGEWTCSWRQPDLKNKDLVWRTLIAVGASPDDDTLVRVSVRIRIEHTGSHYRLEPPSHTFGAPAIVRTLLREHSMTDAGVAVEPRYRERRVADIDELVGFLRAERQLPVLVVTKYPGPGHTVDASELARELAGLAHVEVLPTHLAAMRLTDRLGRELSVWGGSVRLYWPEVQEADPWVRHRLWTADRLQRRHDSFASWVLPYLGALGAASVPEHPVVEAARQRRIARLAEEQGAMPPWVKEQVREMQTDLAEAQQDLARVQGELDDSEVERLDLTDQLEAVRKQFGLVQAYAADADVQRVPQEPVELTVTSAFELAVSEADEAVIYLEGARDGVSGFQQYKAPERLYEALTAVSDAAEAWRSGTLRMGFGAFFTGRGYEFAKRNPAALAKPTRHHYERQYKDAKVVMQPHLKVDQATAPDQCLRVYWYVDETAKKLVVGHVGRHLPD